MQRLRFVSRAVPAALLALLSFGACKGDDAAPGPPGEEGQAGSAGKGKGGAGSGAKAGSGGGAGTGGVGSGSTGGSAINVGGAAPEECAIESKKADPVPLDLIVMLDQSTSMERETKPGTTKWVAVTEALDGFFDDAKSSGIGVGIQYFGQVDAAVPATCLDDAACGKRGPCAVTKACNGLTEVKLCDTSAACGGKPCERIGTCSKDPKFACFPSDGPKCGTNGGKDLGDCKILEGYCVGRDSCDVQSYAVPAVEVAALPGAAKALSSSVALHKPVSGTTPTGPALEGALKHATEWAASHPDHIVAVVLATDGLPTGACKPIAVPEISALANTARMQKTPVGTYVIGVFGPDELAQAKPNLDQIAKAGSDQNAFLVTADATASAKFLEAMNTIRKTALSCDFTIPKPDTVELDYKLVNVRLDGKELLKVPGPDKCAEAGGGWYYDVEPSATQSPKKVSLCPIDCDGYKANNGKVDVVIGCSTKLAPIK